jgi:hypothetical protein
VAQQETVTLVAERESIELPSSALLVALDDTGHEEFAPTHSVFGLGGCACLVRDYGRLIADPWQQLKAELFGGREAQLHAADLRQPSEAQASALSAFFKRCQFFRFAVVAPRYVDLKTEHPLLKIICSAVMYRIGDIAKWAQPTQVAIVIERSDRLERDLVFETSGWTMGNGVVEFQPRTFLLPKSVNSPLLEVADFVIHTAGAHIRRRFTGRYEVGRDFEAVFHSVDSRLCYYNELVSAADPSA